MLWGTDQAYYLEGVQVEKKRRKINNDVYIGIFLMLFSGFFLRESAQLHPGAALFPRIILTTFLLFSILITALGVRKTLNPALCTKDDHMLSFQVVKTPFLVFGTMVLYVVLFNVVGFFPATVVFMLTFFLLTGNRRFVPIILVTASTTLLIWFLFVRTLNIRLP